MDANREILHFSTYVLERFGGAEVQMRNEFSTFLHGVYSQLCKKEIKIFALCNKLGVRDICSGAVRGPLWTYKYPSRKGNTTGSSLLRVLSDVQRIWLAWIKDLRRLVALCKSICIVYFIKLTCKLKVDSLSLRMPWHRKWGQRGRGNLQVTRLVGENCMLTTTALLLRIPRAQAGFISLSRITGKKSGMYIGKHRLAA